MDAMDASPQTRRGLAALEEKLDVLLAEQAIAVDPGIKFNLKKEVAALRARIDALRFGDTPPAPDALRSPFVADGKT